MFNKGDKENKGDKVNIDDNIDLINTKNNKKKLSQLNNNLQGMNYELRKFLDSHRDDKNQLCTHISQGEFSCRLKIERDDIDDFWKLYSDLLYNSLNSETPFVAGIGELPRTVTPVRSDIDIKANINDNDIQNTNKHLYSEKDLEYVISIYHKVFRETIQDLKEYQLITFVLEKPRPYVIQDQIKSGFHLHFIYLNLDKWEQNIHIIPRVNEEMNKTDMFKPYLIKSGDALDKGITSKYWLIYGSSKNVNKGTYMLSKIYDSSMKKISLEQALKRFQLQNSEEELIEMKGDLNYYLPQILSINAFGRPISKCRYNLEIISKKTIPKKENSKKKFDTISINDLYGSCSELVSMLSVSRVDSYDEWMKLGWILYNVGDGTQEFMNLWIEKSKQTTVPNSFSEIRCVYEWERMEKRGMSIGSLKHIAEIDNPEKYNEYKVKCARKKLNSCIMGGHSDLAGVLYEMYGNNFVCAHMKKDKWYIYENHKWEETEEGVILRSKISSELIKKFTPLAKEIHEKMCAFEDADESELDNSSEDIKQEYKKNEGQLKKIHKLKANLKSAPFKNNIMKECKEAFYKKDFLKKLDSNPYLIHFTNGVMDLRDNKLRAGTPEDYISLSTGYEYKEFEEEDEDVINVRDFLSKVYPDPQLRQYFLEYCAMLLKGGNVRKIFLVLSGVGNNAKSVVMELLELTLGQYMIKFPTSLITGKRTQSSSACPEIMRAAGVRFAVLQEPGGKDRINVGVMKELTGNDSMYGRGLFENGVELKPMFNTALICNNLPAMPSDDPAGWERIRVLLHESRFLHINDCPKTVEEQRQKKIFPRDTEFSEKLPSMKQSFMWILIQERKRILRQGRMQDPVKVKQATDSYKNRNNVFLQFITEMIVKCDKSCMTIQEVYTHFREWFKNSLPNQLVPTKLELTEDLNIRWGESKASKWFGYRLRTLSDDENDGKLLVVNLNKEEKEEKDEESDDSDEEKEEKEEKEENKEKSEEKDSNKSVKGIRNKMALDYNSDEDE